MLNRSPEKPRVFIRSSGDKVLGRSPVLDAGGEHWGMPSFDLRGWFVSEKKITIGTPNKFYTEGKTTTDKGRLTRYVPPPQESPPVTSRSPVLSSYPW